MNIAAKSFRVEMTNATHSFEPESTPSTQQQLKLAMTTAMRNLTVLFLTLACLAPTASILGNEKPNVLVIYADDLGFGDVRCYNDESKVATPNLDALAAQGMRFSDAHSAATVCTPSRYSLLTGQYAFRLPNHGRVFAGLWGPNLIAPKQVNLATMLKDVGYRTGCVGKWHLGMTFFDAEGQPINKGGREPVSQADYSRDVEGTPVDRGFDYFFGTPACPTTDWFYAYVDGNRVPNPPKKKIDKSNLPKHPYSKDCRPGMIADNFDMEAVDLKFLEKSLEFIKNHRRETPDRPFFLFHSMQAVHLPSFAAEEFKNKSGSGPHGDFIFEMDHIVGRLLDALKQEKIADNTIVIFTSDNGPEVDAVHGMRNDHQHDGSRPWRGIKRDNWEGGHRVPFIVRWPDRVPAGTVSDQLMCQTDIIASLASILKIELPDDCAEDSFDLGPAWLSNQEKPIRDHIVHQGFAGIRKLAIRSGEWKYLNHQGSGGNNYAKHKKLQEFHVPDTSPSAPGQLYNMVQDPGETKNLYFEHPEIVEKLSAKLTEIKEAGRSRK